MSGDDLSPLSGLFCFTFLIPAHPGSFGQNPESRKIVVVEVVVHVPYLYIFITVYHRHLKIRTDDGHAQVRELGSIAVLVVLV